MLASCDSHQPGSSVEDTSICALRCCRAPDFRAAVQRASSSRTAVAMQAIPLVPRGPHAIGPVSLLPCVSEVSTLDSFPRDSASFDELLYLYMRWFAEQLSQPAELASVGSLQELDLSNCPGLMNLPGSVDRLSSLRKLSFAYCEQLTSLSPSLGRSSSLCELDLARCEQLTSLQLEQPPEAKPVRLL